MMKDLFKGQVFGFALLFSFIALLGHNEREKELGAIEPTQPMDTAGISGSQGDSELDVGDPVSPSDEAIEFCVNNKEKLNADRTGGGEEGGYCRMLLKELDCSHGGDCPDDPYEAAWDSEEWSDVNANGI